MKNTLAENMRRFATKNLKGSLLCEDTIVGKTCYIYGNREQTVSYSGDAPMTVKTIEKKSDAGIFIIQLTYVNKSDSSTRTPKFWFNCAYPDRLFQGALWHPAQGTREYFNKNLTTLLAKTYCTPSTKTDF